MLTFNDTPRIDISAADLQRAYDRVPFGFSHDLDQLDVFAFDSLQALADASADHDHFVASSAPTAGTEFYAVDHSRFTPRAALDDLASGRHRILIKRPEEFDSRLRGLLDTTFARLMEMRGGLGDDPLTRLESTILISSARAITPFHFDPEVSFFFQIEGDKVYHLYEPDDVTEPELERFYKKNVINIGQLDLTSRTPSREHVFTLEAGKGLHQPHHAPHWVETHATRSISYVIAFETQSMRETGYTRAFNHYARKTGLRPELPGANARRDRLKSDVMRVALPARRRVRETIRRVTGR